MVQSLNELIRELAAKYQMDTNALGSDEARDHARRLNVVDRDARMRAFAEHAANPADRILMTPSWSFYGEEARCTRCRDLEHIAVPAGGPRWRHDILPCPDCQGNKITEARLAASGIPATRRKQTLESYRFDVHSQARNAHAAAVSLCEPDGSAWLILTGPKGCGKTHLARGIGYRLMEAGFSVSYHRGAELESLLRASQNPDSPTSLEELTQRLADVDALILDDLWATQSTEWALGQLETLLDRRYDSMALTVVVTNLPATEIERLSGRLYSRFRDVDVVVWVDMVAVPDYRQRAR